MKKYYIVAAALMTISTGALAASPHALKSAADSCCALLACCGLPCC